MVKKSQKSAESPGRLTSERMLLNRPADPAEEPKAGDQIESPALLANADEAKKPVAVQNDRIHATYLGLGLERDKENRKLLHLDFSFNLENGQMTGLIPDRVAEAWNFLAKTDNKLIEVRNLEPITLAVFKNPTEKETLLHLPGATFSKAVIAIREEVGKGKTIEVVRFSFRLLVERTAELIKFAAWRDTEDFWIELPATQRRMAAKA